MMAYLTRILPPESPTAYYCAARLVPGGEFVHRFFTSLSELSTHIQALDTQGHTMYVAQAQFLTNENRKQVNVKSLRSFFFDIDCGEGKPFESQMDAIKALKSFIEATSLPSPVVESSGNGLYARWILSAPVAPQQWKVVARKLKQLASEHGFAIDPGRTADTASVLRPVGSTNRKNPASPKLARIIFDSSDISFSDFASAVEKACKACKISTQGITPPGEFKGLNDEFAQGIGEDHPPSDAERIAAKCGAVRRFKELKGDVSEPVWYDLIGVLRFTEGGEEILQAWSSGHPAYTPEDTSSKIEHHKDSGVGPTSCRKIGEDDHTLCLACPHSGKIKSPIVLGYAEAKSLIKDEVSEEAVHLPHSYKRTEQGLVYVGDGGEERFYPYDLYPTNYAYDHTLQKEVVTIRHKMSYTGEYKEFTVAAEMLHDAKTMLMALQNNHVHVQRGDSRKLMVGYLDDYMVKLRAKKRLNELHPQMGWSKDGEELVFVLGSEIFRRNEVPIEAGLARSAPGVALAFKEVGDVEAWKASTRYLAQPGMEPLAFAFLAGAFGSPLMWFTGHSGAMVSMVGHSGLGKTMTGKWALSAYGDPDLLTLQKDDTPASMISRLGIYGSLPAYIDEISNLASEPLSDLVYRVTQGRERNRLTQKGEEKGGRTSWKTLAVCSSNHPLTDRLAALKTDASAEINRLLEIHVTTPEGFGAPQCREIFKTFEQNHGGAGRIFVQYLVDHQDEHREKLDVLIQELERRVKALPEERFWIAIAAITVYGSLVAKKLGLVDVDVSNIMTWVLELIRGQRSTRNDLVTSELDIIGQLLDRYASGGLITGRDASTGFSSLLREPRGELVYRIMHDENILLFRRDKLRSALAESYGSYSGLKNYLTGIKALKNSERRMVLGKGTYFAGSAVPVWEIDLSVPAMGRVVAKLVEDNVLPFKRVKV